MRRWASPSSARAVLRSTRSALLHRAWSARVARQGQRLRPARAGGEDLIALLGAYEGATASSVTVAGQDEPTGTIAVRIEAGEGPIYAIGHRPRADDLAVRGRIPAAGSGHRRRRSAARWAGSRGVMGIPAEKDQISIRKRPLLQLFLPGRSQPGHRRGRSPHCDSDRPADLVIGAIRPAAAILLPSGNSRSGREATPVGHRSALGPRSSVARSLAIQPRRTTADRSRGRRLPSVGRALRRPAAGVRPLRRSSPTAAYVADPRRHRAGNLPHLVKPMARFPAGTRRRTFE